MATSRQQWLEGRREGRQKGDERERKNKRVRLHVSPAPEADKQAGGGVKWDDRCWVCINSII